MSLVPATQTPFHELVRQADTLAQSRIIPKAYQRQPADVVAAGLAGQAFGWDVMTSLRNYHVIDGTASLRPEAMLGLVRRAGHSVSVTVEPDAKGKVAVATGKRADNGDSHTVRFSTADATKANLTGKKNWQQYEEAMLQWRSVSALCRFLFPDVVLGAGYTPEEIGAEVNEIGTPIVTVTSALAKKELIEACGGDRELAIDIWADRGNNSVTQEELDELLDEAAEVVELAKGSAGIESVDDEPAVELEAPANTETHPDDDKEFMWWEDSTGTIIETPEAKINTKKTGGRK